MGVTDRGTDEWWVATLAKKISDRRAGRNWSRTAQNKPGVRPGLDLLHSYLDGDPPLPIPAAGWTDRTKAVIKQSRLNMAELVCGSVADRIVPGGYTTAVEFDADGDRQAAALARANDFATLIPEAATIMLALREVYLLVGAPDESGFPTITVEDPRWTITAHDDTSRHAIAGLIIKYDEWADVWRAFLFRPGYVRVAVSEQKGGVRVPTFKDNWEWDEDMSGPIPGLSEVAEDGSITGFMPLLRAQNRNGLGEFEPHLDVIDRINTQILQRLSVSATQAHRQRALKNLPKVDDDGNDIDYTDAFSSDPGSLWSLPAGVEVWESAQVDLTGIRAAIKDDMLALAAVTRTPLHYLVPDAANGSAEGAAAAKEAAAYRIEDRRRRLEKLLADAFALSFRIMGDTERAHAESIRVIWLPAERHSLAARASALAQTKGILPLSTQLVDIWQTDPADVAGVRAELDGEALTRAMEALPLNLGG